MGFTTAFIGSLTLTSSVLYLSVVAHRRNRQQQSLILRESALRLQRIIDPSTIHIASVPYQNRESWKEIAKDKWNGELEGLVKKIRNMTWTGLRENLEDSIAKAWGKGFKEAEKSSKGT